MTGRASGLLVGAVTSALLVAGCSGGSGQAAGTSTSPAGNGTTGTPSASTTSSPMSPAASPAGPSVPPEPTGTPSLTPVPSKARTTLAPVAPSKTVTVGGAARTVLLESRRVTVQGRGPGELSGPAVALTLQVTNGSRPLDLDAVTVSAGVRGQEASSSDAAPAKPFSGRLAPGAKASGVYVFVLPPGASRPVGVVVSLTPDLPVARFTVP